MKSYVKDSFDFRSKLPEKLNSNSSFYTFDIQSLYTSIPHDLGYEAIAYWLQNSPREYLYNYLPASFIIGCMKIVLENNIFKYNGNKYHQRKGVAMGTQMAPSYAILVVGFLEENLYTRLRHLIPANIVIYIKENFRRFMDDCFIIWPNEFPSIQLFNTELNNMHPEIKYECTEGKNTINFLDLLVYKNGQNICTTIYSKPSANDSLTHFYSNLPKHVVKHIPYTMARRIYHLVSEEHERTIQMENLRKRLLKYKYPETLVQDAIAKTYGSLTDKRSANDQILPLVFQYNKGIENFAAKIRHSVTTLQEYPANDTLQNKHVIISYRKGNSVASFLNSHQARIQRCGKNRCKLCDSLIESTRGVVQLPNREIFHVNASISCSSKNVVYSLICQKCKKIYIGETQTTLRKRIALHRLHTFNSTYTVLKANKHFQQCEPNFLVLPLYKAPISHTRSELVFIEQYFIKIMSPELNE